MPTLIEKLTAKQSIAEARAVAERWHGSPAVSARLTDFQGMFSKTLVVEMEDGAEWIVQLRDNEIDTTKVALARAKLGAVVPPVHRAVSSKAHFAFVAPFVRGTVWCDKDGLSTDTMASIATQIGRLLALGVLGESSAAMVDSYVLPRLQHIISRELSDDPADPLRARVEALVKQAPDTKILPLALIHEDVNSMNVSIPLSDFTCLEPDLKKYLYTGHPRRGRQYCSPHRLGGGLAPATGHKRLVHPLPVHCQPPARRLRDGVYRRDGARILARVRG